MAGRSAERIIQKLLILENEGRASERAELTGDRFLSLLVDPDSGYWYVLRHPIDETDGIEVPWGTGFWEYANKAQATQAYGLLLHDASGEEPEGGANARGRTVRLSFPD